MRAAEHARDGRVGRLGALGAKHGRAELVEQRVELAGAGHGRPTRGRFGRKGGARDGAAVARAGEVARHAKARREGSAAHRAPAQALAMRRHRLRNDSGRVARRRGRTRARARGRLTDGAHPLRRGVPLATVLSMGATGRLAVRRDARGEHAERGPQGPLVRAEPRLAVERGDGLQSAQAPAPRTGMERAQQRRVGPARRSDVSAARVD